MIDFSEARARFTARQLDAGGVRTHYLEAGAGEPLLLLHGGGAGADSLSNWYQCIDAYARSFHVIAMDLLGFGRTGKPDPASFTYSQEARNRHAASFIEALGLGPVHLIGNSMGGATSIGVCVERPELVRRVVLMGAAAIKAPPNPALSPIQNYDFTREGMEKICRVLANKEFPIDPAVVEYRLQLSLEPQTRAAYSATMGWVKEQKGLHYPEDFIARVKAPCMVVNGKLDLVVPISSAYRLLELIPQSRGYILPNCGHWAMLEHPEEFVSVTSAFLQR